MKSTGMVRAVDKMGRVVIPKEIRKQLKVENDVDSFEIYMDKKVYEVERVSINNILPANEKLLDKTQDDI